MGVLISYSDFQTNWHKFIHFVMHIAQNIKVILVLKTSSPQSWSEPKLSTHGRRFYRALSVTRKHGNSFVVVAFKKTKINCWMQLLWNQKMRFFHLFECIVWFTNQLGRWSYIDRIEEAFEVEPHGLGVPVRVFLTSTDRHQRGIWLSILLRNEVLL